MSLRAVRDESSALTISQLQEQGNRLVTDARDAALDAIRASMISDYMRAKRDGHGLERSDIVGWRDRAREAQRAWRKVDSICTELVNEIDKTVSGMEIVQ